MLYNKVEREEKYNERMLYYSLSLPGTERGPFASNYCHVARSREAKSGLKAQQRITVEYNSASNEDEQVIFEQID